MRGGGGSDSDNSQGVTIDKTKTTLIAGETLTLTATLNFTPTATATLTWSIEGGNNNIASINGDILHALTVGTVEISATTIALDGSTRTGTQDFVFAVRPAITTALKAVATGTPNQVKISWAAVAGATGYKLYQTTGNLSGFEDGDPANLASASPAATSTDVSGITTNINLGANSAKTYFLLTAITNGIESKTNGAQAIATAHPLAFGTVAGGSTVTATIWMDRNLGAERVATSSADENGFGDHYQWGRPADGHQTRGNGSFTATLASIISPAHAEFITIDTAPNDWTAAGVDNNGAIRSEFWSRIDGSSICPTGFRVPTRDELENELNSWDTSLLPVARAFASNLKWPAARNSSRRGGSSNATFGLYWSITTDETDESKKYTLAFNDFSGAQINSQDAANGYPVRCIQN